MENKTDASSQLDENVVNFTLGRVPVYIYLPEHIAHMSARTVVSGLGLSFNILLILVITRTPTLRDKLILPIGLAVADGCHCTFGVLGGIRRIFAAVYFPHTIVPTWKCLLLPEIPFKLVGILLCPLLALCISVERYVAVRYPMYYHSKNVPRVARKVVWLASALFLLGSILYYLEGTLQTKSVNPAFLAICGQGMAGGLSYERSVFRSGHSHGNR